MKLKEGDHLQVKMPTLFEEDLKIVYNVEKLVYQVLITEKVFQLSNEKELYDILTGHVESFRIDKRRILKDYLTRNGLEVEEVEHGDSSGWIVTWKN